MIDEEDEELLLADPAEAEKGGEQEGASESGDFVLELEGEEAVEEDTPLVRKLRSQIRDLHRSRSPAAPAEEEIVVGPYPEMEDFDWDADKHREAVLDWTKRSHAANEQKARRENAQKSQAQEYQDLQVKYQSSLSSLPVKPEEAQAADKAVRDALPESVQIGIAKYTDNPGKIVLALGRYPAKLDAIASEPDPIKQLKAIWQLEGQIKVTNRRAAPSPEAETIQRGSAPITAGQDKQLAALEKEAAKTGDRSKIIAYKRDKKKAA